jgi:hypothetical protein
MCHFFLHWLSLWVCFEGEDGMQWQWILSLCDGAATEPIRAPKMNRNQALLSLGAKSLAMLLRVA